MTCAYRSGCSTLLLLLALTCACGDEVHIRLVAGDDELAQNDCDAVAWRTQSFFAELQSDVLSFQKCVNIVSPDPPPATLQQLEARVAARIVFEDVPADRSWTIWVEAFQTRDCSKVKYLPLLCGKQEGQVLPSSGGDVAIHVACVPPNSFWPSDVLNEMCRIK